MSRTVGPTAAASSLYGGGLAAGVSHERRPRRAPALFVGAAVAGIAALALAAPSGPPPPSAHSLASRHGLQSHPATRLPLSLAAAASASIGVSAHSFWPVRHGAWLLAQGGGIHSTFTASGAVLRVAQGTLGLSLTAVGRGHHFERVAAALPARAGSQVLYRHGSITEFYRNGPYGLEQGFTLRQRPRSGMGSLVLALGLGGSLLPRQVGSHVVFRTHTGAMALRYGQLSALDAKGRQLPALVQIRNGSLQLRIDDSHASYPLRIDPFIQQGSKLTGSGEIGSARFGGEVGVALSADGNTALIGGPCDNGCVGAVWVFTRSGSTWTQQGNKLTGSGESGKGEFGSSVALSSDGNTALIGGENDNRTVGAAWVFTRSGSTWTQQGSKLTASDERGSRGEMGRSVALSADGNTALVGGPGDDPGTQEEGAAWVFTRSGTSWAQQGPKLKGSGLDGGRFGRRVALSSDGNTALVASRFDNSDVGAVWVFTRSGSTWTQQGSKLTASDEEGPGEFGASVALSSDGNTALIGGTTDNGAVGAAWVFTRSDSTWTQQGSTLTASDESGAGEGAFGWSVALSSDGNTALVGAYRDHGSVGAVWVFTRLASTWTQQGAKLTASDVSGEGDFGSGVALSSDGGTALVGGPSDNKAVGAAWVFANLIPTKPVLNPPTLVTGAASSITQIAATLNATVNPNGQTASDCHFEYGTTAFYGSSVPCSTLPGSGASPVAVSASVGSLSKNTTYHVRIVATNAGGIGYGNDRVFTTLPDPPTVETEPVSSVTQTSATLNATVNPQGGTVSDCHFEYGTSGAYGSSAPCALLPGSGESPVAVSASLGSLSANTTYHVRIVATNRAGTSYGSDETLTTLTTPLNPGAPVNLVAVGGNGQVALSWGAPTDGVGVVGYRVYRDGVQVGQTASTGYVDAGLTDGSTYSYYVVAYDAAGNVSSPSNAVSATPQAATPGAGGGTINATPTGPPTPSGGWSVAYADAFNLPIGTGSGQDTTWYPSRYTGSCHEPTKDCEGFNSNEMEVFNSSSTSTTEEGLKLSCNFLEAKHYRCGMVDQPWESVSGHNFFSWSPGHGETWAFECVCKFPPNTGEADSSWWTNGPPWTDEIDFFESFGWNGYYKEGHGWEGTRTGVGWNGLGGWTAGEGALPFSDPSAAFHRYTMELFPNNTFSLFIDGEVVSWANKLGPAKEPDMSEKAGLILSYGLRIPEGHVSGFTSGSRTFSIRSVAVYEDGAHAGQNITNGGLAPGTPPPITSSTPSQSTLRAAGSR